MAGTGVQIHCAAAIVMWSLVLVANDHGDWRAQRDPELRPRLDLDSVLFVPRSRERTLARPPTVHLGLDILLREGHPGRAAVDNAADGAAVGFAITGNMSDAGISAEEMVTHVVTLKYSPQVDMMGAREIWRGRWRSVFSPARAQRSVGGVGNCDCDNRKGLEGTKTGRN